MGTGGLKRWIPRGRSPDAPGLPARGERRVLNSVSPPMGITRWPFANLFVFLEKVLAATKTMTRTRGHPVAFYGLNFACLLGIDLEG